MKVAKVGDKSVVVIRLFMMACAIHEEQLQLHFYPVEGWRKGELGVRW